MRGIYLHLGRLPSLPPTTTAYLDVRTDYQLIGLFGGVQMLYEPR